MVHPAQVLWKHTRKCQAVGHNNYVEDWVKKVKLSTSLHTKNAPPLMSCKFSVDPWPSSSSAYPMITYTHSVASNLPIKPSSSQWIILPEVHKTNLASGKRDKICTYQGHWLAFDESSAFKWQGLVCLSCRNFITCEQPLYIYTTRYKDRHRRFYRRSEN